MNHQISSFSITPLMIRNLKINETLRWGTVFCFNSGWSCGIAEIFNQWFVSSSFWRNPVTEAALLVDCCCDEWNASRLKRYTALACDVCPCTNFGVDLRGGCRGGMVILGVCGLFVVEGSPGLNDNSEREAMIRLFSLEQMVDIHTVTIRLYSSKLMVDCSLWLGIDVFSSLFVNSKYG